MIKELNRKSFYFGVPGIILQILGQFMRTPTGEPTALSALSALAGTILLITGLYYYAKAKGRNPAWCLMGLLSIIGIIVLACLKDKSGVQTEVEENKTTAS